MDLVMSKAFSLPGELVSRHNTLKHLLMVALSADRQSHQLLQESVFQLTAKAEQGERFSDDEISFLRTVYGCPWWGGKEHGVNEAKREVEVELPDNGGPGVAVKPVADGVQVALAGLARHYLDGGGQCMAVNVGVYQRASIVRDTLYALREYIRDLYAHNKPTTQVSTTDVGFRQSSYARDVEIRRKHVDTKGFIFSDGTLMLDQLDPRLMVLGNRFRIEAMTTPLGAQVMTRWRVEGTYRFECFAEGAAETVLPLHDDLPLRLPSVLGLSLAEQDMAKPFDYFADWAERYVVTKV